MKDFDLFCQSSAIFVTNYLTDEPKLTGEMMWKLSKQINSDGDLRTLAMEGLGLEDPTVNKNLQNKRDINEAAYQVLREWRTSQENDRIAYQNLCEALKDEDVKMKAHIQNVLEPTWKKRMSKVKK